MLATRQRHYVLWVIWAMCLVAFMQYKFLVRGEQSCMRPESFLEIENGSSHPATTTSSRITEKTMEGIPKHIYQTWKNIAVPEISHVNSWQQKNPDHEYTLFTDNSAGEFLECYYGHRPDIVEIYNGLKQRILAADMLRYLIVYALGGIYTDVDTSCTKPIRDWLSDNDGEKQEINMVVGIEADVEWEPDRVARAGFVDNIQFIQWTVMGKPDHPILNRTIEGIVTKVRGDMEMEKINMEDLVYDEKAILDTTGPWRFSRVIRSYIDEKLNRTVTNDEFHNLDKPKLFGDVLVLPVNAWAPESPHSHSGPVSTSMLRHWQRGSWRKEFDDARALEEQKERERLKLEQKQREMVKAEEKKVGEENVKQDTNKDEKPNDIQVPPPAKQQNEVAQNDGVQDDNELLAEEESLRIIELV